MQSGFITAMLLSYKGNLTLKTNITFRLYSRNIIVMAFSFEDKFCKHFVSLRKNSEVLLRFNIDQCLSKMTDKISIPLYYDEKLDVKKEKRQLDQFSRRCKLSERGWQVLCEIATYIFDFNYSSILFNREFAYTTCFKFGRQTNETFVHWDITVDQQTSDIKDRKNCYFFIQNFFEFDNVVCNLCSFMI